MISINLGNSFRVIKMRPDYTSQITEGKNKKTNHKKFKSSRSFNVIYKPFRWRPVTDLYEHFLQAELPLGNYYI